MWARLGALSWKLQVWKLSGGQQWRALKGNTGGVVARSRSVSCTHNGVFVTALFPPPSFSSSDGDIDVLAASTNDDTVRYFDSNGASPPTFTTRIVTASSGGAVSVLGADYDTDGDVDVVLCSKSDGSIRLYMNDGAAVPTWTQGVVTASSGFPMGMALGDVGHDGTLDVVRVAV